MHHYPSKLTPVSYTAVINCYTGGKKAAYMRALQDLRKFGYRPQHAIVKMFVKPDRIPVDEIHDKAPRAIQYRSMHYNLELSRYIKAYEHEMYQGTFGGITKTRCITKGINNYQKAALLIHKAAAFRRPRFLLFDHSKFDSTINVEHLKTTHKKYQRAFRSAKLQGLLNSQKKNTCYSKHGIKYRAAGTRMSGDPDTGCGNTQINMDTMLGFLMWNNIEKYEILMDGDDSIVIVEDGTEYDLGYFEQVGFTTKCETTLDIHQAEYCQSRLVLATEPVMVRNPNRVLSHYQVCRRNYPPNRYAAWLAANGECEQSVNAGVPVLQEWAHQLTTLTTEREYDDDLKWKMQPGHKTSPVSSKARDTMYQAWGIPHNIQVLMESYDFTSKTVGVLLSYSDQLKTLKLGLSNIHHYESTNRVTRTWMGYQSLRPRSSSGWWSHCA